METKSIETCPICGCTVYEKREWHQCRQFGRPVCMECCRKCEYNVDGFLHCNYGEANNEFKKEIERKRNHIRFCEKQARRMYKRSFPRAAERYEQEAVWEESELRRMMKHDEEA